MEGSKDTINGPVTPFKALPKAQIKESSGTPHITSSGIQRDPVSGLFASPTFVTKIAGSTEKERDCAAGDPVAISNINAEDAETLAQTQFATPSPFPVRTKRARSTIGSASDAQLAASYQNQDRHELSSSQAGRPEGFSPIACFPSLEDALVSTDTAAPQAQRDLFANGARSPAVQPPLATATAADQARRPRKVTKFGELVAEGFRQQLQHLPPADAVSSDDEESQLGKEHVEVQVEAPARLILSAKDEQWIEKMVAHYSSKAS